MVKQRVKKRAKKTAENSNVILSAKVLSLCVFGLLLASADRTVAESLYDPVTYRSYVADHRASAVGDSVTILIVEYSEAASNSDSEGSRELGASLNFSKTNRNEVGNLDIGVSGEDSKGTRRKGNLRAQISAVVEEIDPRGQMRVAGTQQIVVNGEQQDIVLSGWIRPYDISANNTILSTRLSRASIEYRGDNAEALNRRGGLFKKAGEVIIWAPQKALDLTAWLLGVL